MKLDKKTMQGFGFVLLLLVFSSCFVGCITATKVERNEETTIKKQDYQELYFVKPAKDPRNVVPRVVEGFKSMGFNVREVELEKPIEGLQGTGFLISDEGHILTCAHVVGKEKAATVWIAGAKYEADVVNKDKDVDIAILKPRTKINSTNNPLSFRSDKSYKLGEDVMTLGFPMTAVLGNKARLSKGLISSTVGQKDDPKHLQFSAEVQPGNSGCPLFDKEGIVVGVVSESLNPWRMALSTGGALPQNVNFAIKSDVALDFIRSNNETLYKNLKTNQPSTIEEIENEVVKVRSGIISEEFDKKPKLVATLQYHSFWDLWYRFNYFEISIYDFETQDLLFRVAQSHDTVISNEGAVIKDTLDQVRKTLNK